VSRKKIVHSHVVLGEFLCVFIKTESINSLLPLSDIIFRGELDKTSKSEKQQSGEGGPPGNSPNVRGPRHFQDVEKRNEVKSSAQIQGY
jgi:hypothetical protein